MQFGDLILCRYLNYKNDPAPMVFVLLNNGYHMDGLNSHYLNKEQIEYLRVLISYFPNNEGNQVYYYLKRISYSIPKACYRRYFVNMVVTLKQWKVTALSEVEEALNKYEIVPQTMAKYKDDLELAYKEEKRLAKNARERERYWLKKADQTKDPAEKDLYRKMALERGSDQLTKHKRVKDMLKGLENDF